MRRGPQWEVNWVPIKKNSGSKGRPNVNEVSFYTRPHYNAHNTLGVNTRATGPRLRVDSLERGGGVEKGGKRNGGIR
jgi:hypothetical protein